jgi:predicted nucleic acid-binding protein
MRFLLDTCVLSDGARPAQYPRLAEWLAAQSSDDLAIAALTIGELRYGVERLAHGRKRERLKLWLDTELLAAFADRILDLDVTIAESWALLRAAGDETGRPLPLVDGLLLATAQAHGLTFVTRDVSQLDGRGVRVFTPY